MKKNVYDDLLVVEIWWKFGQLLKRNSKWFPRFKKEKKSEFIYVWIENQDGDDDGDKRVIVENSTL